MQPVNPAERSRPVAETSLLRLYLMRALYFLNLALLGRDVWPAIVSHGATWEPVRGVAFSFWGALSLLSALGLRYPLRMVPLLLMQFVYKIIWLLAVALPQWEHVKALDLTSAMLIGAVVDLIVIPWPYVFTHYVTRRGDRWRPAPKPAAISPPA
jgi:hypothetical protein